MHDAGRRRVLAAAGVVFAVMIAAPLAGAASSGGAVGQALGAYLPGPPRITVEYADGSPAARYEGILRLEFGPYSAWSPGFVNRRPAPGHPGEWQADALVELYPTGPGKDVSLRLDEVEFLKAGSYPLKVYAQTTGALLASGTFVVDDCLSVSAEREVKETAPAPSVGTATGRRPYRPGETVSLSVTCDQATAGDSAETIGEGSVYIGGRRADVIEWGVMGPVHQVLARVPFGTPPGTAAVRVVDAAGNAAETVIDVGAPGASAPLVVLRGPGEITAGRTAKVTATVREAGSPGRPGRPLAGIRVTFGVVGSAASVDPSEAVTDADGTASTVLTAGRADRVRVIAQVGDASTELDIRVKPAPWWTASFDLTALAVILIALGIAAAFFPGWAAAALLRTVADSAVIMLSFVRLIHGLWTHDVSATAVAMGALLLALIGVGIVSAVGEREVAAVAVTKGHEFVLELAERLARRRETDGGAAQQTRGTKGR